MALGRHAPLALLLPALLGACAVSSQSNTVVQGSGAAVIVANQTVTGPFGSRTRSVVVDGSGAR